MTRKETRCRQNETSNSKATRIWVLVLALFAVVLLVSKFHLPLHVSTRSFWHTLSRNNSIIHEPPGLAHFKKTLFKKPVVAATNANNADSTAPQVVTGLVPSHQSEPSVAGDLVCGSGLVWRPYWREQVPQPDIDRVVSVEGTAGKYLTFEFDHGGWNNIRMVKPPSSLS